MVIAENSKFIGLATATLPQIAQKYFKHIYPWFGIPDKIISDRDPRFISHFGRGLAKELGVTQNVSTAFHPQTDGLTERTNQWLEQYLRLVTAHQEDWSKWLPLATAVHNNSLNATLKTTPHQLITGVDPPLTPNQWNIARDRKSTRLNSSHRSLSRMPSSA